MRLFLLMLVILFYAAPVQAQVEYFVEAAVSSESPYVGQQITYSFRLYSRVSRTNRGSIVDPTFDGFWKREFGIVRQFTQQVDGFFYEVKERSFALYPLYAGEIVIEPSAFVLGPEPGRAGEVLTTGGITVQVRPLPERGDVTGFDGAVGQLEIEPTVDRQTTNMGEPVRLRLVVRGTGNIEQLPAPSVPVSDVWRVYGNPGVYRVQQFEDVLVGEKVFEWLLLPQEAGQQPLPILTLSYFDPDRQSYESLSTAAVTIDVLPAAEGSVIESAAAALGMPALKPITVSAATSVPALGILFWLLWAVPPAAFAWLWRRQQQEDDRRRNAARYRRSEALVRAQKKLESAQRAAPEQVCRAIRDSVLMYFADKLNTDAGSIQYEDIERAMARHGLDERLQTQVFGCLSLVDEMLYAPFEADNSDSLIKNSIKLLIAVDARWKPL